RDPCWRECERAGVAAPAHRAPCCGRVTDERLGLGATVCAARQMRQVAGEPEQLKLKRERERVERRACASRLQSFDEAEEAGQRLEGAFVPLLFGEEAQ